MKKLSFIVMACLLVLGLTQCKKNEPLNNNNEDNGDRVNITLKLENGGQKVHPEEENGLAYVIYEEGDVVYVGSDGKYVGYLTYNGSLFTGSINAAATEGQPLQFIFMGGQDIHTSLTENSTEEYTFNIGNQSNGIAVISCAASYEDFSATKLDYTSYLRNKCALAKFDLGEVSTDAAITLTGMKTQATIGFDGMVTNLSTTGDIVTYGTGSTRYAVVLSDQAAVTSGTVSAEGYEGTFSIPTAAYTNAFLTDASMTLTATSSIIDLTTPLTLEALTNGTVVVSSPKSGMQYTLNGGAKTPVTSEAIPVSVGDKVSFYGDGTSISSYNGTKIAGGTAQVKVYGNIMSLLDETGYATLTTLPNQSNVFSELFKDNIMLIDASGLLLPAITMSDYCYSSMFYGCSSLTTAPQLPATTLSNFCYYEMFSKCTSLPASPALPATTMADYCYCNMFCYCSSLTTAPALPATALSNYCYSNMFSNCTSLIMAPALPATTLANSCYSNMFGCCTSLTTAPALPATTLAYSCYSLMFLGCTSLTTAPALPATTLADNCYNYMFNGCTSLTTAPTLPATTLADRCYFGMFHSCTSLATAPALPVTTLASFCYSFMFFNCTNLTTAPTLPATTLADNCYKSMFSYCTSLTTASALPATMLADNCYRGMFSYCTSLTTAPVLPATTLANYCYYEMFQGCTHLRSITCLATSGINSNSSTTNWVKYVASTGTFTKASGATWPRGVNGIPTGWTVVNAQ